MIFRISAAAELGRPALADTALKHPRRPRFVASLHGDSLNAQAPLAKIDIRSKSHPEAFPSTTAGDTFLGVTSGLSESAPLIVAIVA